MFELMLVPFIACLVLTGIHVYLGFHVIERGVIFLDLALAQMAALGGIVGLMLGFSHSLSLYLCSLFFTFLGALIFSNLHFKKSKISQEAFIGICYVVASAVAILLLSKSTVETEMLKDMLIGNILTVSSHEVILTAVWYALIGCVLYFFRNQFLAVTRSYTSTKIKHSRLWDFAFYALFGMVVTSSVKMAGVFLVFSFLIVPSVCALLLAKSMKARLQIGWMMGALASLLGITASAIFDLPTGAAIVTAFGFIFAVTITKQFVK